MTPYRATLRALAMNAHVVDKAFLAAYHAELQGDSAQASDRFAAGVAGLKRLLRMAAGEQETAWEWGEEE